MKSKEFIYALTHWVDGKKVYFYVGRSEREPGVRFNEHRYAVRSKSPQFKTDVYEYIRNNVMCEIFEEEILCWVEEDNPEDCEDFWVIKLVREGHELQNEKCGDAKRIAVLGEAYEFELAGVKIDSPKELRAYRERKKSEELRKKIREEEVVIYVGPTPEMLAAREAKRVKAEKRRIAAEKRDAERKIWLAEQERRYRAGEIDALGNELKENRNDQPSVFRNDDDRNKSNQK